MNTKRRRFLRASAAGLAATSWPGFIRQAFGAEPGPACPPDAPPSDSTSSCEALLAAGERARADGRPLFVIVIPREEDERHQRGVLFGSLINWGDDATLAALGLCEVVCASMTHVHHVVPESQRWKGEPLAVLADAEDVKVIGRLLGIAVGPKLDELLWRGDRFDEALDELGGLVQEVVRADRTRAARLGSRAQVAQLAGQARARLKDQRVPGSKWAVATGCGTRVELLPGEQDLAMGIECGMGHVPKKAARMLHFFVRRQV